MGESKPKLVAETFGVIVLALTAFVTLSLYSYDQADPSYNSYMSDPEKVSNFAGVAGAFVSDLLVQMVGALACIAPLALLYIGVTLVMGTRLSSLATFLAGFMTLVCSTSAIVNIRFSETDPLFDSAVSGGMLGQLVSERLTMPWFATYGSYIVLGAMALTAIQVMARVSLASLAGGTGNVLWKIKIVLSGEIKALLQSVPAIRIPFFMETVESRSVKDKKRRKRERELDEEFDPYDDSLSDESEAPFIPRIEQPYEDEIAAHSLPQGRVDEVNEADEQEPVIVPKAKKKGPKEAEYVFQQEIFELSEDGDYEYPSLKLLDSTPPVENHISRESLLKGSKILEMKLADFGIDGKVTQVLPGPVITIYEFAPAPGVKVSRIVSLSDDLAMSLRALSIRIVAPIPGKSVVGIEVPNAKREPVFLKEILSSEEFLANDAALPLALGRDISGEPMATDLASVPHLLIAGSTGSGKSVGINTMICSILYRLSPKEAKFIMIDPKMLELSIYDGIPHLIAPVVTNPKKAANALKWVVGEMERRYAALANIGVRNVQGYNKLVEANLKDLAKKGIDPADVRAKAEESGDENVRVTRDSLTEKLPFIIVVVDELADLMMVSSKDVEESLARLAQMARASGIHLIVATQRPSVDVLTGLIKANFPARISFQVRSRVDSRTIIDSMGAEKLLGKGDMLYLPPGASALKRVQGPFVSDEEIHRVVKFLKAQKAPDYNEEILMAPPEEAGEEINEDTDECYDKAVELVSNMKHVSVSMIQRRLRIGYNRAARIVETMERQGLVGPSDGAKPREVLMRSLDDVETYN